ncbi:MAG: hypothetical protein N2595_01950 [bacterium]|nr:hypothetical protein [bacterium]
MRLHLVILIVAITAFHVRAVTNEHVVAEPVQEGTGTVFRFAPAHITFTLPYYWTVIPESELAAYKAKLRELFPQRPVPNYVLAVQRKALFTFALPYVLFEVEQRSMPTREEIEQERAVFADSVRKAYLDLHRQGMFGEVKPMDAQYDPQRNVIIGYWEMVRAGDKRRIAALAAIFPCRYGFLRLHIFLPADRQAELLPVIDELISSVTFDEGYGYDPKLLRKRRQALSPRTALLILAVLAIVWLALRLLVRRATRPNDFMLPR